MDYGKMFGRMNTERNVNVLDIEDGASITQIDGDITVYPIGSVLSARYEHVEGIVLSLEDAEKIGLEIE